ncbi:hypothetical protein STCU_12110 [Strigomonas culicis]|uniref:Uncharacterized protein n=1 Tax=Strigomonas culicis TaxID=28005 RepID=S9TG55_9TRYP|nr:hypothetical protein STCU_12110 [Strigomonas culicis]|eukprot:EPY15333.1 hypothetical protein STCU_12110 [Strigomonas culicis]
MNKLEITNSDEGRRASVMIPTFTNGHIRYTKDYRVDRVSTAPLRESSAAVGGGGAATPTGNRRPHKNGGFYNESGAAATPHQRHSAPAVLPRAVNHRTSLANAMVQDFRAASYNPTLDETDYPSRYEQAAKRGLVNTFVESHPIANHIGNVAVRVNRLNSQQLPPRVSAGAGEVMKARSASYSADPSFYRTAETDITADSLEGMNGARRPHHNSASSFFPPRVPPKPSSTPKHRQDQPQGPARKTAPSHGSSSADGAADPSPPPAPGMKSKSNSTLTVTGKPATPVPSEAGAAETFFDTDPLQVLLELTKKNGEAPLALNQPEETKRADALRQTVERKANREFFDEDEVDTIQQFKKQMNEYQRRANAALAQQGLSDHVVPRGLSALHTTAMLTAPLRPGETFLSYDTRESARMLLMPTAPEIPRPEQVYKRKATHRKKDASRMKKTSDVRRLR